MDNIFAKNFEKFGKEYYESAKELGEINAKVYEQLVNKQRDFVNELVELSNEMLGNATEVKGVQDAVNNGMKFMSTYNEKLLATARETTEIFAASRDDYQAWFENSIRVVNDSAVVPFQVAENVKKAAKEAA